MSDLQNYITMLHFAGIEYGEEDVRDRPKHRAVIVQTDGDHKVKHIFCAGRLVEVKTECGT